MPETRDDRFRRLRARTSDVLLHDVPGQRYWYRPGQLLVHDDALPELRGRFRRIADEFEPQPRRRATGMRRLTLRAGRSFPILADGPRDIPGLVDRFRDDFDGRPLIAPNHVYGAAPNTAFGPAVEAAPTDVRVGPLVAVDQTNPDYVVGVLDTGYRLDSHPLGAEHARLALDPDRDRDELDVEPLDGLLDFTDVHGSFIADIIRQRAPHATVRIAKVLLDGLADEDEIADGIERMAAAGVDVLNLSLYGYSHRDREPVTLRDAIDQLPATTAVVAAAGNDGLRRKTWPAAMRDRVIGVAAVHGDPPQPPPWTNTGPWLRACADGVDVVSSYVVLAETGRGGQRFTGNARWSGTSFAAPKVAAAIIQRAMDDRTDAATAARAVLRGEPLPDLGVYVA